MVQIRPRPPSFGYWMLESGGWSLANTRLLKFESQISPNHLESGGWRVESEGLAFVRRWFKSARQSGPQDLDVGDWTLEVGGWRVEFETTAARIFELS
ncbi:hypothetical protein KKF38_04090 [Patescibacteria group bacterium]|nr:hypothetical protein [Patescibacteria group bacterium]